jgi:hypothetical protein
VTRKLLGNVILEPSPAGAIFVTASSQWEFNDGLNKEKEPSNMQDGPK